MEHYLQHQYRETRAKYTKFSSRLEKSQERGDFYRLTRRKQNFLLSRVRKLWEKLRILEVRLKIATAGASLACLMMVSSLNAQQYVEAPDKNPLPAPTVFGFSPVLVDLDADGDLDMIATMYTEEEETLYFENTGSASAPVFVARQGEDNPFSNVPPETDFQAFDIIGIKDLDGDGDMDILSDDGYIIQNAGTNADPDFSTFTSSAGNWYDAALGDIDDDGDYDIIVTDYGQQVRVYENTGGANSFVISETPVNYPIANWDDEVNDIDDVHAVDMDGDGDLDLVIGVDIETYDPVEQEYDWSESGAWLRNTGTVEIPEFEMVTGNDNPFSFLETDEFSLGDLDGDGDTDLLFMSYYMGSGIRYFELDNNAFAENKDLVSEFYDGIVLPLSYYFGPQFVDFDGDGDLDLFVWSYYAENSVLYYEYQDTQEQLKYALNESKPLGFLDEEAEIQVPIFVDLDDDGDTDVIRVTYDYIDEEVLYDFLENTGSDASPTYGLAESIAALAGLESFAYPNFVDIDNDGDMDMFLYGEEYDEITYSSPSYVKYFESTGSNLLEFTERTGEDNPLEFFKSENYESMKDIGSLVFSDVDEDGDMDMITTGYYSIFFFENTGSASEASFTDKSDDGPFSAIPESYYGQISLADMDGDGDADLLVHEMYGMLTRYYENTGGSGTGVKFLEAGALKAYPNPAAEVLYLSGGGLSGDLGYTIVSLDGRKVDQGEIHELNDEGEIQVPVQTLKPGAYFIRVDAEGAPYVTKFVKQ